MQAIIFIVLKKAAPYLISAGFGLGIGSYCGFKIGSNHLAEAKLALSVQQSDDAKAVAAANAASAVELTRDNEQENAAEAALATVDKRIDAQNTDLSTNIVAQASHPDEDAPDAPVLANTLNALDGAP